MLFVGYIEIRPWNAKKLCVSRVFARRQAIIRIVQLAWYLVRLNAVGKKTLSSAVLLPNNRAFWMIPSVAGRGRTVPEPVLGKDRTFGLMFRTQSLSISLTRPLWFEIWWGQGAVCSTKLMKVLLLTAFSRS